MALRLSWVSFVLNVFCKLISLLSMIERSLVFDMNSSGSDIFLITLSSVA